MDSIHSIDLYQIATLEDKIDYLELAINELEVEKSSYLGVALLSDKQLAYREDQIEELKKQLKKEKRKKFIVGAIGVVLVVILIL